MQMTNGHMKRCLKSLIIREIQVKTTMRFYFILVRMALMKKSTNNKCCRECEEKGTLLHCGGDVNWCRHYGKQYRGSLRKLKIELPYDPAVPLLGIYQEETLI